MDLLISILIGLAMIELYAWLPKASEWLLDLAIRSLPDEERERCHEEWAAALEALPNTLAKLWHAVSFVVAACTIRSDALGEECHLRLTEVVSSHSELGKKIVALSASVDHLPARHAELCSSLGAQSQPTIKALNDAWLLAKQRLEATATPYDRLGASLGKASRNFERFLQSRDGVRRFWQSLFILAGVMKDMLKAEMATRRLVAADESCQNAFNNYFEIVKEVRNGRGMSQQS
jgi:hypothetical protein